MLVYIWHTERGTDYALTVTPLLQGLEQDTLDLMSAQGRASTLHPDITLHIETRTRPFMFNDTPFDAALYAGTPAQVSQWAGTRALRLLSEDMVPVCSPHYLGAHTRLSPEAISSLPLLQQSTPPGRVAPVV